MIRIVDSYPFSDYLTVNETAKEPPQEEEGKNSPTSLAIEATYINQNFSQQMLAVRIFNYHIAGNFRWCKFSHKLEISLRNKISKFLIFEHFLGMRIQSRSARRFKPVFIFAQEACFRIMRKFAPFENFPLYGTHLFNSLYHNNVFHKCRKV